MADVVSLAGRYERNPVLRALARLIPYGSAVEVATLAVVDKIREDRVRTFFDELGTTNAIDNPDLLHSEDLIHRFLSTLKFAMNTRQREKICWFARLLKTSMEGDDGLSDV